MGVRGGQQGHFLGPTLFRAPATLLKRMKYSNRTVTLIQKLKKHSVDHYTTKVIITFNFRKSNPQKFPVFSR